MKLVMLGKASTYVESREYDDLMARLKREVGDVHHLSERSRDGIALMELYDVVQIPAILVTRDDGTLVGLWQFRRPTPDEILAAIRS